MPFRQGIRDNRKIGRDRQRHTCASSGGATAASGGAGEMAAMTKKGGKTLFDPSAKTPRAKYRPVGAASDRTGRSTWRIHTRVESGA